MQEAPPVLVALVLPDVLGVTATAGGWLLYKHFWDVRPDPVYPDPFVTLQADLNAARGRAKGATSLWCGSLEAVVLHVLSSRGPQTATSWPYALGIWNLYRGFFI